MLDGLLGRGGFYSKCKSLIKLTRTRIDVVRRKRSATQKFLRKDIADLLANGLETNAFGRAEGLVMELILSSCYDFIDHVCEIILKHLPILQKLRECPEDCREAVASLMFAAARFSDLPELRDLRDLFQERYGSSLEYFVNQKLAENITPKPPSKEKKVQLIQEIALEFSIPWDSRGFEDRMSNPPAPKQQNQNRTPAIIHAAEKKVGRPFAEENVHKTLHDEVLTKKRSKAIHQDKEREVDGRNQIEPGREVTLGRRDELKRNVFKGPELTADRYKPPSFREETVQREEDNDIKFQKGEPKANIRHSERNRAQEAVETGTASHGKALASVDSQHNLNRQRENNVPERDLFNPLARQKPDPLPVRNGANLSTVDNELGEDVQARTTRKRPDNVKDGLKSNFKSAIPPPYVKPSKSKHKADLGLTKHAHRDGFAEENDTLTLNPISNGDGSENSATKSENEEVPGRFTEIYYKDEVTPKRRPHRKKHSRSKSNQGDEVNGGEVGREEERVIRRVSTSRRKNESKQGLQILFDEEPIKKDEEEKMIDKLLLHYSKKPCSTRDSEKLSRKNKADESKTRVHEDSTPTTSRSMSLPPLQVTVPEPEPKKVFTRAASFQQDSPAKHVHPKLPDYDDLTARFAALRASKD